MHAALPAAEDELLGQGEHEALQASLDPGGRGGFIASAHWAVHCVVDNFFHHLEVPHKRLEGN